jgi:hypothetical protein
MIAVKLHEIWNNKPKLSLIFWFAFVLVYVIGFVAVAAISNPAVYEFLEVVDAPEVVAIKMSFIRLPIIVLALLSFPILLWKSFKRALLFLKIITAVVIVVYLDDHLVLYEFVGYPQLAIFKIAIFLRPFAIMALLWMTFELHFIVKIG